MAAKVLTEAGADVVMLEAGIMWDTRARLEDVRVVLRRLAPRRGHARAAVRRVRCGAGRLDARRRALHDGAWHHVRLVPHAHARRAHESLGPHLAALRPGRLSPAQPRRPRRRLADQLRRPEAVLRPASTISSASSARSKGLPNEPDGHFLPPPKPRCYELLIKQAADALKITCIPSRLSILTRPHNGRKACHYCGQCGRGCAVHANFSSPSVLLPPALATKRLTIVTGAMARDVTTDETGLATGVTYIDTTTGRENHVRARIVVLAASACESARILLNSRSSRFPHGLANSSGTVGRYLTDTTGVSVSGFIPKLMDRRAAQRRWRRRRASLHAVVARQPAARFPAWLPHRDWRRPAHAERRVPRRHPQVHRHGRGRSGASPPAATASASRTTTAASTARR